MQIPRLLASKSYLSKGKYARQQGVVCNIVVYIDSVILKILYKYKTTYHLLV